MHLNAPSKRSLALLYKKTNNTDRHSNLKFVSFEMACLQSLTWLTSLSPLPFSYFLNSSLPPSLLVVQIIWHFACLLTCHCLSNHGLAKNFVWCAAAGRSGDLRDGSRCRSVLQVPERSAHRLESFLKEIATYIIVAHLLRPSTLGRCLHLLQGQLFQSQCKQIQDQVCLIPKIMKVHRLGGSRLSPQAPQPIRDFCPTRSMTFHLDPSHFPLLGHRLEV